MDKQNNYTRQIDRADRQQLEQIRQQVEEGAKTVVMHPLGREEYVHDTGAVEKMNVKRYKSFYGLPEDLEILPDESD